MKPRSLAAVPRYVFLSLLAVLFLIPFYLIARNALMTDGERPLPCGPLGGARRAASS